MSVYNSENHLVEAIDSILNQSFADFELITINDGSVDGSEEIILGYMNRDSRMILIQQRNMGLTKSLNRGINRANGTFIARQDADDISLYNRLQIQQQRIDNYSLIGSNCLQFNGQNEWNSLSIPNGS